MPDPVIQNLRTLANKGEGKTAGSRIGHETVTFQFVANTDSKFKFDDWTNINGSSVNPSKADLQAAVRWASLDVCERAVENWPRKDSLFMYLARQLFFDESLPKDWCDPEADVERVTLPLRHGVNLTNAPEQWLFKLLVTGPAIAYWREKSGLRLNITGGNLHQVKQSKAAVMARDLKVPGDYDVTHLDFNWTQLLEKMRNQVRTWVKQGFPAPGVYLNAGKSLDNEFNDILENVAGFKQLRTVEYLIPAQHEQGYDIKRSAKLFFGDSFHNDRMGDIIIALNHSRFVMWMDWRIGTEMCLRRGGGIW